jgi:hypothetical protein
VISLIVSQLSLWFSSIDGDLPYTDRCMGY